MAWSGLSAPQHMLEGYSGATRIVFVVGDPIAQVKSPAGVTALMRQKGLDGLCVPAHVRPADLPEFLSMTWRMPNVDGVLVTVPHKVSAATHCELLTDRAQSIGAVNTLRRGPGGWHGDMCDGEAFVAALTEAAPWLKQAQRASSSRALLVGAGGAGSAIAHALVDAGVGELAVHDVDLARRDEVLSRLRRYVKGPTRLVPGTNDPAGFDLVCNASPLGMRPDDPLPIRAERLSAHCVVGDVVTVPAEPALIAAARAKGCAVSTGSDMFRHVAPILLKFLLEG